MGSKDMRGPKTQQVGNAANRGLRSARVIGYQRDHERVGLLLHIDSKQKIKALAD